MQPEWEWRLQVTLLDASNLETVHFRNLLGNWIQVNPLCSLVFNGRCVAESKPCMGGGTNPAWREVLETRQHDGVVSLPDATIFAVILHFDTKSKYRHIGTAIIPLADFVEDAWNDKTYQVVPWRECPSGWRNSGHNQSEAAEAESSEADRSGGEFNNRGTSVPVDQQYVK